MPKDYFQGMAPRTPSASPTEPERSIRNIPINTRRERTPAPPMSGGGVSGNLNGPYNPLQRSAGAGVLGFFRRFALWGIALVMVVLLGAVGAVAFRDTSVVVMPRTHALVISEDIGLTAYPENSEQSGLGGLTYTTSVKTYEEEASVPARGYEEVSEYAKGTVTVYNEYGANSVRLIKNTRFKTPDGLIFRIRDSIVVPGKRGDNPGTVTAIVYADQPGEKYNAAPTARFSIPGLEGGDMFTRVYARSTSAFIGGFSGAKPKVAESDMTGARDKLRARLEEKARGEAQAFSLDESLVFPQLLDLSFETLPPTQGSDGQALLRERLTATLPVFPEDGFAHVLASATRADAGVSVLHVVDVNNLSVRRIAGGTSSQQTIDMRISGNTTLEWQIDIDALGKALAGIPKASFDSTIAGFDSIESARAFVRPMWRKTFPADPVGIRIEVQKKDSK